MRMSQEDRKLMARIGRRGGRKRALSLTTERRKEIARMGAYAKWHQIFGKGREAEQVQSTQKIGKQEAN
jgi:general stress protein YciG